MAISTPVMKEILRREGMDVGTVRAPLPNLVASDMALFPAHSR